MNVFMACVCFRMFLEIKRLKCWRTFADQPRIARTPEKVHQKLQHVQTFPNLADEIELGQSTIFSS